MARDVNDVVVLGYGSWSDVNALPTLGFGVAEVLIVGKGVRVSVSPRQTILVSKREVLAVSPRQTIPTTGKV